MITLNKFLNPRCHQLHHHCVCHRFWCCSPAVLGALLRLCHGRVLPWQRQARSHHLWWLVQAGCCLPSGTFSSWCHYKKKYLKIFWVKLKIKKNKNKVIKLHFYCRCPCCCVVPQVERPTLVMCSTSTPVCSSVPLRCMLWLISFYKYN